MSSNQILQQATTLLQRRPDQVGALVTGRSKTIRWHGSTHADCGRSVKSGRVYPGASSGNCALFGAIEAFRTHLLQIL
ncbi:hypothetical protein [Microlunatus endophyticus]|uniref:hypothetical protein n=1 Tax=Microlunatus endophyticus TaxID=1716077 RepID=UPI00166AA1B9|nr:hypothetical protein [Microlunatus endophyticus]